VALPWYVLADHGGVLLLGTVLAAYGIPRTVMLAVGGHASDRWRPWTVMMSADTVRTAVVVVLAVVSASGRANAQELVPIAALLGAGEGLFLPGSFAIVPSLLTGDNLQAGNALLSSGTQLATLVGPAIGGALVALVGPSSAFGLDAASFAISALSLAGVRNAQRSLPAPNTRAVESENEFSPGVDADVTGGKRQPALRRLVRSERVLQIMLLVIVAANLGSGGVSQVALPALVHGELHSGAGAYGGLIAAFGGGALIGTLAAGQWRRARRPAIVGSAVFLAEAGCVITVPILGSVVGASFLLVAYGALNGFGNVVMITAFQRWGPPAVMGRLMGLMLLASFGVFPVSVALGAIVVHDFGPAAFFTFAGAALAAAMLVGLSQRTWRDFGYIPPTAPLVPPTST
jgi:predicted MFS family arabinose efflux permease